MEKIKINKKNLEYFMNFSENNGLKYKPCVRVVYNNNNIYFGETSHKFISWNINEKDEVLKNVVALINGLLKGYKLIYESEGENEK